MIQPKDFVSQINAGEAAQTNVVTVRGAIETLVIGVGREHWEGQGRVDIYLDVVDKFLKRLSADDHQLKFWEKKILEMLREEKWIHANK